MITNLLQFAQLKQNVLIRGESGIGKTSLIKEVFTTLYGDDFLCLNAATLDPFLHLIGIPQPCEDKDGKFVKLILPEIFHKDTIRAIFIDEINRAQSKHVLNALLELLQFKSINGIKLNNLDIVWAAANPDDGVYATTGLDPAHADRFQIHIELPYELSRDYFIRKYNNDYLVNAAAEYWDELSEIQKKYISPRRLDNALEMYGKIDLKYIIPAEAEPERLIYKLKNGSIKENLILIKDDVEKLKNYLNNPDILNILELYIFNSKTDIELYLPLLFSETIASLLNDNNIDVFIEIGQRHGNILEILRSIYLKSNHNNNILTKLSVLFKENKKTITRNRYQDIKKIENLSLKDDIEFILNTLNVFAENYTTKLVNQICANTFHAIKDSLTIDSDVFERKYTALYHKLDSVKLWYAKKNT